MKYGEGLVHNQSTNTNFTITSSRNSFSFPEIFGLASMIVHFILHMLTKVNGFLSQHTITDVVLNGLYRPTVLKVNER